MKNIKTISIVIALIFIIGITFSGEVSAVGDAFSDADSFLGKRRTGVK